MSWVRQNSNSASFWSQAAISAGTALFLLALPGSAILEPRLRLLHALQALIYVAILLLTRRNSPWGFGIGAVVPAAWNCMNLFLTHLIQTGTEQLWSLLRTGHASQPVSITVAIGGLGHFILILGCLIGFLQLRPGHRQVVQFVAGGLLALAYFALIVTMTVGHGV
jgi:hypothetical protein